MSRKALFDFLSGMGQSAARVRSFVDGLDDAAAARLLAAAETGDNRTVLRAMAEQTWGTSPARTVPEAPAPTGSRSPIPFERRVVNDPEIRRTIEAAGVPPALRAGVDAGDPEAIMAAYRGAGRAEDSIRTLRKPPDQVAAEGIASQFDRALGGDAPARQMELPLSDGPTELIPRGVRGPSIPAGGPASASSRASHMESILDAAQRQTAAAQLFSPQAGLRTVDGEPAFNVWMRENMGAGAAEDAGPYRFVDRAAPRPSLRPRAALHAKNALAGVDGRKTATAAAAAAGLGGAAYLASQSGKDLADAAAEAGVPQAVMDPLGTEVARDPLSVFSQDAPAVESGGEADLAAETSPPPAVAPTPEVPEPTVAQAPQDYSLQARALINRLNDMRRAAGGEVPEAQAMMKEINRLLAMGNEQRRSLATFVPGDEASQMYKQAQVLIDQVNQMYRQGMTPNSPQVQRLMAQVRQLQAQGDAIRNRRAR